MRFWLKTIALFACVLSVLLMVAPSSGCNGDAVGPGFTGFYPLATGNNWTYEIWFYSHNFRPVDSTATTFLDTLIWSSTTEVTGTRNLSRSEGGPDSISTWVIRQTLVQHDTFVGYHYHTQDFSGLWLHGYEGDGRALPKPVNAVNRISFSGLDFESISQIVSMLAEPTLLVPTDSLYREFPPVAVFEYPIMTGRQWTFRVLESIPIRIDKRYEGTGTEQIDNAQYHYREVLWLYDWGLDGEWDPDISILDHVSDQGLLRRTVDLKNLVVTGPTGDTLGLMDHREEIMITSVETN